MTIVAPLPILGLLAVGLSCPIAVGSHSCRYSATESMLLHHSPFVLRSTSAIAASVALVASSVAGCASSSQYHLANRCCVSSEVEARFGHPIGEPSCPREIVYPNGISLDKEIAEDEAVVL